MMLSHWGRTATASPAALASRCRRGGRGGGAALAARGRRKLERALAGFGGEEGRIRLVLRRDVGHERVLGVGLVQQRGERQQHALYREG